MVKGIADPTYLDVAYVDVGYSQSIVSFVNREEELARLEQWWQGRGGRLGMIWGRRRVGKTALLERFASGRRTIFHTMAGRPPGEELRLLSRAATPVIDDPIRDLGERPFRDWDEAFEMIGRAASGEPLLLVLDEFPEALPVQPLLPNLLRAHWDRLRHGSQLRLLLCGSAIRRMESLQVASAPLYGRLDLRLLLQPFAPSEVGKMLPRLSPSDRAQVWGVVGGIPLYLEWWDQERGIADNLLELAGQPDSRLLAEGEYVIERETLGDLGKEVLYALGSGQTKYNEIAGAVGTDPSRTLDRLIQLRLVERVTPVTEEHRPSRRRIYRIYDNFLDFWLGCLSRYRTEIERGLGPSIVPVLMNSLDDHMGKVWEEAFRIHLRRLAASGLLGDEVVAIGRFWRDGQSNPATGAGHTPSLEIDAVALAGRSRRPTLVGEAKWAKAVSGARLRHGLEEKSRWLPGAVAASLKYAICARESVEEAEGIVALTSADLFG